MDVWGDHCLVCPCSGDRVVRHNALRNVVFDECNIAGLAPERERNGLLPGNRVPDEGLPRTRSARRPADIWVPRGENGSGEAWDFTVRSGLQGAHLRDAASDPSSLHNHFEDCKRRYLDTDRICTEAGFRFLPLAIEAHSGSFSSSLRGVLDWVASASSSVTHESKEAVSLRIAQRVSCVLHRECARAVLRRTASPDDSRCSWTGWDEAVFESNLQWQ